MSDIELLDHALELLRADGPERLSFGRLAARTNLAASTLVQRFGSKATLLQSALHRAWDHLEETTEVAAATAGSGGNGIVALLVALTGQYEDDPADQLRLLREDLRDPELRRRGVAWFARLEAEIEARLPPVRAGRHGVGTLVIAQWQGAVTLWSFRRDGPPAAAVEEALGSLLSRLKLLDTA